MARFWPVDLVLFNIGRPTPVEMQNLETYREWDFPPI